MPNPLLRDRQLDTDVQRPNLCQNPGFEIWTNDNVFTRTGDGSATSWFYACPMWQYSALGTSSLLVKKETAAANRDAGSSTSAACTFTAGSGWADLVQAISASIPLMSQQQNDQHVEQVLAGKTVTLSVRVKTSTPNSVFPVILDGTNWQRGTAHTGDGTWQTLTKTVTLGSTPATNGFAWGVVFDNNSCTAYVDNVTLVEGAIPLDFRLATSSSYIDYVPNSGLGYDVPRYNLLTNGGFEIWQRGPGPFTSGNAGPDRWGFNVSAGSTLRMQKGTVPGMSPCPEGKTTCGVQLTFTPSGANPYGGMVQNLNDVNSGIANYNNVGQFVAFSAWVWCDTPSAGCHLEINGIGTGIGRSQTHPGNSTWQWLTVVWPISVYPSVGVFMTGAGNAYVDNAMVVLGVIPCAYQAPHPQEELARCYRYCQRYNAGDIAGAGVTYVTNAAMVPIMLPVKMAATPTVTVVNPADWSLTIGSGSNVSATAINLYQASASLVSFQVVTAGGLTAGDACMFFSGNAGKYIQYEANP